MQQLTKSNIISAIKQIDNSPSLRSGRESNTYDLIFQDRAYPPILVLSEANKLAGGKELTLKDFGNSTNKAFKILRDLDFIVKLKEVHQAMDNEERFNIWLLKNAPKTSNQPSAYMTAIKWLSNKFVENKKIDKSSLFEITDVLLIEQLYKETLSIQKDPNSYIYNPDSPSYGDRSFFSASLKKYKDFLMEQTIDIILSASSNQQFDIDNFISDLDRSPLKFGREMVTRFVASLIAKPFVLLSGLSGSGKTKIAQTFAKWICASTDQYEIIPVGADWTNREPLLGYPDGLDRNNYVLPDNGALQLMLNAQENPALPYFLILDEMNLSHVERYFADFLSIMESSESIKLYTGNKRTSAITEIPSSISWPANLYIIGTVNIDETTYMFSPKVLDRANVIEFRLKAEDIAYFLSNSKGDHESVDGKGVSMATDFVGLSAIKDLSPEPHTHESLLNFFGNLQPIGAEFGYRTTVEIIRLCDALQTISNKALSNDACMDIAIIQKLLPKIHGSRSKVARVLESLMGLCLHEELLPTKLLDASYTPIAKYPISFEKLRRMYKNALDNGFTSYAEA